MKYIEIGATYKIKVPANSSGFIKKCFDGKELKVTCISTNFGPNGTTKNAVGALYGTAGDRYINFSWLTEMIKHCPQVEHYIKSQQKEKYISPITGKKT